MNRLHPKDNPILFSNGQTEALEEALHLFLEAFEEYAKVNDLTVDQISAFKQLFIDAYLEKRAVYYMEQKLSDFNDYLDNAFHAAWKRSFDVDEKEGMAGMFYYNNKRRLISNESY